METAVEMIARLREEKAILLAAILKVEDWAFGEGYFLTPSMKARFELVRKLAGNPNDAGEIAMPPSTIPEPKRSRRYSMSPEGSAAKRDKMIEYWRRRKARENNI